MALDLETLLTVCTLAELYRLVDVEQTPVVSGRIADPELPTLPPK
jgi:hypothetical protein